MKRLGIIGGIGPESTVVYYRALVAAGRELGGAAPPILINSIDRESPSIGRGRPRSGAA
jgi:aspartate/glutamate racemase